jgi:thiol-disulfide isomerase/thioredoxin
MIRALVPVVVAWLFWSTASNELVGVLDPVASASTTTIQMAMFADGESAPSAISALVPDATRIFRSFLIFPSDPRIEMYVAELPDGAFRLLADFNTDGVVTSAEVLRFPAGSDAPQHANVRVQGWPYATYPMAFSRPYTRVLPTLADGRTPISATVTCTRELLTYGTLELDGRPVKFALGLDGRDGAPHTTRGRQYVDTDGDGLFDTDDRSWEYAVVGETGTNAAPIFRVGAAFVSLQSIDLARHRAVFVRRTRDEYLRFELRVGDVLPDFSFVDLQGRPRHLSDARGKFVLLDFWGTWCGPCIAEMPYLKAAYDKYRSRGLEIIGMDSERPNVTPKDFAAGLERLSAFVADHEIPWIEARDESIKALYEQRFVIRGWPTLVLIDPDGRIVSANRTFAGEPGLRGGQLGKTLESLLIAK